MTRDFRHIDPSTAKVLILEGSPSILGAYPKDLQQKALEQLTKLGVQVRTGSHVTDIQPGYVMVGDERIESVCTLWAAGVQASPLGRMLADALGMPNCLDRRSCIQVDEHLNPPNHPEIYIIGDLAHVEENGQQIPGTAQPAMQMGMYAADRIGLLVTDPAAAAKQKPFHYFDKGDMATIGRKAAVARIAWPFHAHWSGFMAWLTWLVVHIFFLIGFRNRWGVFRQWAYTYIGKQDGVRLIVGSQVLPGWDALAPPPVPHEDEPTLTTRS
jgi:NADH dehydrogenase